MFWYPDSVAIVPLVYVLTVSTVAIFQLAGKHRGESNISVDRVLQWSVDRLTSTQRYLLTQLSVLRGAFDAELATALVLEPPVNDADLHDLERRSLLQELPKPNQDSPRLFQLQPRIREFVQKQADDLTTAHERASDYFWTRNPAMWLFLDDLEEPLEDFLEQFKNEFPNVRLQESSQETVSPHEEAFYHQCQLKQYPKAFETVCAYDGFLSPRGYYRLQVDLYSQLHKDWQPSSEELRDYGIVCKRLGGAYRSLGQYQRAIEFYQQSLEIRRKIGDREGEAGVLNSLGNTYSSIGQYQQASEFYQQSLEIRHEIDHSPEQKLAQSEEEAISLMGLGAVYVSLGQYQQAINFYQQSLEILREISKQQHKGISRSHEGNALLGLGNAHQLLGQHQQAFDFYQQSLEIMREICDLEGEAASLDSLGIIYKLRGQYPQAIDCHQRSLEIMREIGARSGEAKCSLNLGNAYNSLEQCQQAITCYQQGLEIAREIGDQRDEAGALFNIGNALAEVDQRYEALQNYQQALAICEALKLGHMAERCKSAIAQINQVDAIRPRKAPSISEENRNDDDWYTKSLPTERKSSASPSSRQTQNWWLWFGVGLAIALLIWWLKR